MVVPIAALAAWWMAGAIAHGVPGAFLPFGASMLGFVAAFLAMRGLDDRGRRIAAFGFVGIGAASAAGGLVAEALRAFPIAARAQQLWRVSTTLDYANAGGLMLAMALLVALGLDHRRRLTRLGVCLCAAALVATQSRGAVLAAALALCVVPLAQLAGELRALAVGTVAGLAVVAMSPGDSPRPFDIVVVVVAVLLTLLPPSAPGRWRRWCTRPLDRRRMLGILAATVIALALLGVGGLALRIPISRRLNQDRLAEWSAAVGQWRSAPLVGVGPDKPLLLDTATGATVPFAHSEYLQVLASSGVIGEVLLLGTAVALASCMTRRDPATSCALGAVIAFALAGGVDFVWHLPALGLLGGWAAGLAAQPPPTAGHPRPSAGRSADEGLHPISQDRRGVGSPGRVAGQAGGDQLGLGRGKRRVDERPGCEQLPHGQQGVGARHVPVDVHPAQHPVQGHPE